MNGAVKTIILFGVALLWVFSCSREIPKTVAPIVENIPATPANLTATIGDRVVFLTWSVSDTQGIQFYRVYRSDSTDSDYSVLAEVTNVNYAAINLRNGLTYYFRVTSVNASGFEGYRSLPVRAIPNLYGLIINGGNEYTNSRDVSLTTVAPVGTSYMQIANDFSFEGAFWENFVPIKTWQLLSGDHVKTVYIKYRDQSDQITAGNISATITLDTRAIIDSVIFSPAGRDFAAGDHIHFRLFAEEPDGIANITVGEGLINFELYDDGSRGDAVAGDGIYEVDFMVTGNLEISDAVIYGNFTDRADNSAEQAQAVANITISRPPDPVTIFSITAPRGFFDRLELSWSASAAADFAQYRVYRSTVAGVDSSDILIGILNAAGLTTLSDTGLTQNATYYYRVFVVDNGGLWAGSNEVHAVTNQDIPPEPAVLYPIVTPPGTYDKLNLSWSTAADRDFLRYEVYRSYDNVVNNSDLLIFTSETQTAVVDSNLAADSTYYYGILILDRAGNSSWSNTVSGHTGPDLPPDPATFFPVELEPDYYQNVRIEWTLPFTPDFQVYRLYSWRNDSGRIDSILIAVITNQDSTSFLDHPDFVPGVDTINYWYVIYACDRGGHCTVSNALRVHLRDATPGLVNGTVISDSAALSITWDASDIPDFGSYRLLRDTVSIPDQSQVVFVATDQTHTSYRDGNTIEGRTYYYWLSIYDRRGHSSRSFLGSSQW